MKYFDNKQQKEVEAIRFTYANYKEMEAFVGKDNFVVEQREGIGAAGTFIKGAGLISEGYWIVKDEGKFLIMDIYDFNKAYSSKKS